MLKNHDIQVHGNGYGTFECHLCERQYKRGGYLSKHLKGKHKLKYPKGFTRFTYRQCEDGIFRLKIGENRGENDNLLKPPAGKNTKQPASSSTSVAKKSQKPPAVEMNSDDEGLIIQPDVDDDECFDENDIDSNELRSEEGDDVDYVSDENDDDEDEEVDIEGFGMLNEIEITKLTADSDNCTIKNIDNFKVMKYLKRMPSKKIEIDVQSINVDGQIKSERLEVDEIMV